MAPEDSFEDRLRALADGIARSLSDADLDEVVERFGVDPDRVRSMTGVVEQWLNDRRGRSEPFGRRTQRPGPPADAPRRGGSPGAGSPLVSGGPHPLDLPTDLQGRALSALDSGRFTVRPGSSRLVVVDPAATPELFGAEDLAGDLRARDWITAEGAVTLVGREALRRWCQRAGDPTPPRASDPD